MKRLINRLICLFKGHIIEFDRYHKIGWKVYKCQRCDRIWLEGINVPKKYKRYEELD